MITRIERDFFFLAGVHFDDAYYINSYDLMLSFLVETDCLKEHHIAMSRLEHFIKDIMSNVVFVHRDEVDAIESYEAAGIRVCELPEHPLDQVVAIILLLKMNAIMESRMKITDVTIGSLLGEGVRYPIVSELAESADMVAGNHWWHKPDKHVYDKDIEFNTDNVVKLFFDDDWVDMGLSWKDKTNI